MSQALLNNVIGVINVWSYTHLHLHLVLTPRRYGKSTVCAWLKSQPLLSHWVFIDDFDGTNNIPAGAYVMGFTTPPNDAWVAEMTKSGYMIHHYCPAQ